MFPLVCWRDEIPYVGRDMVITFRIFNLKSNDFTVKVGKRQFWEIKISEQVK